SSSAIMGQALQRSSLIACKWELGLAQLASAWHRCIRGSTPSQFAGCRRGAPKSALRSPRNSETLPFRSLTMNKLRVLIVDDEPLIRSGIRLGLSALDDVEIAEECGSGSEAVDAILSRPPDLVLLDVQMQDCTGLEVVRRVGPERMPSVIFITAFEAYAVNAFELNAVDYLLKPFDEERLRNSIQRARERIAGQKQSSMVEQLQALLDGKRQAAERPVDRIVVRNGERFDFVPVESIDWIESANNYVQLHCGSKEY